MEILGVRRPTNLNGLTAVALAIRDFGRRLAPPVRRSQDRQSAGVIIGGYKPDDGSFKSILAGYYEGNKLLFAGKVRQGFNSASRHRLLETMRPLLIDKCPFANLPSSRKRHFGEGITIEEVKELCWLKPKLVAQVSFTEWTNYGLLRHATFQGLREDKEPHEIVRETQ